MLWLRQATACRLPINSMNSWDRVPAGNAVLALSSSIQQEGSRSHSYFPRETALPAQSLLQCPCSSSVKLVMVPRRIVPHESILASNSEDWRAQCDGEYEAGGIPACQ